MQTIFEHEKGGCVIMNRLEHYDAYVLKVINDLQAVLRMNLNKCVGNDKVHVQGPRSGLYNDKLLVT